jgi:cytochrome c-type biogenesis protein CcmE
MGLCLSCMTSMGLILYALDSNMNLFYMPSEVVLGKNQNSDTKPILGQKIRVGGMVSFHSVSRNPETLDVSFKLHDHTGKEVTVLYQGLLPDLFREGQGIVAQGRLIENAVLRADEVLAKHDENYMPPEIKASLQKNNH